ncbi:magnesium/cobalt transporter CorA [Paraglaciecola sp. L3A3]|uniref:magnesium/cobalt transporter CorA n=1 Tax=Paraglaciecola sp. L3A3 TaxID=2686358 RepID=UPI00131C4AC8|nr:magnesium/cobalt transporter CorA [Paraglaciecola sp. L3A3]
MKVTSKAPKNKHLAFGGARSVVNSVIPEHKSSLDVSRLSLADKNNHRTTPGELPGIEHIAATLVPPKPGTVIITYIDYSATRVETGEVTNLDEFLEKPLPEWVSVRWLNISKTDPYVINLFQHHFAFHTLIAEDVLHIPQRPRIEFFDDHLFVVLRMLKLVTPQDDETLDNPQLDIEQVSLFLYDKVLITFQESPGDVWQPIRNRLQTENRRIRKKDSGYLLYALLDALVDNCFPVLEQYGDILEELELITLENPSPAVLHRIHTMKRELAMLRRIVWPTREVIDQLYREEGGRIEDTTRPYLRDVYEHTIQIVEIIESHREMASGLTDLYMSAVSNRMNEIMKVLTIMASVFIPLTFITGVYGMNFQFMPELSWTWAYPAVWGSFIILIAGMLLYFKYKGWFANN